MLSGEKSELKKYLGSRIRPCPEDRETHVKDKQDTEKLEKKITQLVSTNPLK